MIFYVEDSEHEGYADQYMVRIEHINADKVPMKFLLRMVISLGVQEVSNMFEGRRFDACCYYHNMAIVLIDYVKTHGGNA